MNPKFTIEETNSNDVDFIIHLEKARKKVVVFHDKNVMVFRE